MKGILDDTNNSEPALLLYPATGTEASLLIANTFTDTNTWAGLWLDATVNAVVISSQINGSPSTTLMQIQAGSTGLKLASQGGPLTLAGSTVSANVGSDSTVVCWKPAVNGFRELGFATVAEITGETCH